MSDRAKTPTLAATVFDTLWNEHLQHGDCRADCPHIAELRCTADAVVAKLHASESRAAELDVARAECTRLATELAERKPRRIETAEELDALSGLTVVIDADCDVSQKRGGLWCGYETTPLTSRKLAKCGPFIVLWEPADDECDDCGADPCACEVAAPMTTVYLPGDAPASASEISALETQR